tara:strand:- start:78 stop:479 length:402 start_codon:yes stop_codon:yes gene_type:complete
MKHTLLVITLLIGSFQFIGQSKEWKVMAKKDVTYKHEDDKIMLRGEDKKLSKFKIKCTQGTLKFKLAIVFYKDGTAEEKRPKGTGVIKKGMSSFAFNIAKDKTPTKINLSYEAIGNVVLTKRAKIELLGYLKI